MDKYLLNKFLISADWSFPYLQHSSGYYAAMLGFLIFKYYDLLIVKTGCIFSLFILFQ